MERNTAIGRAKTANDSVVVLWGDGQVTWSLGRGIKGVGVARSAYECDLDVEAGWLVLGDVCMYDDNEVAALVKAARRAVRQTYDAPLNAMRKYFAGYRIRTRKSGKVFEWVPPRVRSNHEKTYA